MYLAGIVFLILTKFMGTKVYGARSWLHLGPLNFQPAAACRCRRHHGFGAVPDAISRNASDAAAAVLWSDCRLRHVLLILMQPDLGEVIIWAPVLLALLFVGGVPLRYLICVILIGVAFIPIAINLGLKPYSAATDHARLRIRISTNRARPGRLINRSLLLARAAGRARDSKRQTRRSSSAFSRDCRCITTTFFPRSASSGDLSEECFSLARSLCS
mgnify:CR=1 FL=1